MYGCIVRHITMCCCKQKLNALFSNAGFKEVLKVFKNIYLYKMIFRIMMKLVYIVMVKMTSNVPQHV